MKKTLIALSCLFTSFITHAFSVSPMNDEIQPFGSKNQALFKVQNTSNQPLPVESSTLLMTYDKKGKEINTDTDDLLILPLNATIPANSYQTFIVKYMGEPDMSSSKSYRVAFETVDVESATKKNNGVKMRYRFLTLLNVKPQGAVANVTQNRTYQKNGKWYLELTNDGNSFARFSEMQWKIGNENNLIAVSKATIGEHIKGNMLLPNDTQSFEFTPFDQIMPNSMKVTLSY